MTESPEVLISREGGVGRLTLNRPKALHSLNTNMCRLMQAALDDWRSDDTVHVVLIDHADDTRGFCAGGDIRMLADSGAGDGRDAYEFFATEYRLNTSLKTYPKPVIAVMDGVTMGGGVGISVHGPYRIATEHTTFAMPETGIGLFPDVGGSWFLPRLDGETGTWLALTGARLKGMDVVAAGVGTHFVSSDAVSGFKTALSGADLSGDASATIEQLLSDAASPVAPASYSDHQSVIDTCFAHDRAEDIMAALEGADDDWARKQVETLATKSPQTIKVALRQMRDGLATESFEEVMRMEYRIARRVVHRHDFLEGVRAVIVEKDNAPKWSPARLEDVSDDLIDEIFSPLAPELDL